MHTLVTVLGRSERPADGYPAVTYRFPDGSRAETSFIGYSLTRYEAPDRLVVLGTAGSMWDQLFEAGVDAPLADDLHCELISAVDEEHVTQPQLDAVGEALSQALSPEVRLRLVPDAFASAEQVALLTSLAEETEGSTAVSLDVTHGYRHLPMLLLMAAMYLRELRPDLAIRHLWYGSANLRTGQGRIDHLDGLLEMADWLSALRRSELTGDYQEIAALIEDDQIAEDLRQAGFKEMVHQGQQARRHLKAVRARLDAQPLTGAGALFEPVLRQRTEWVEHQQLYQRQRAHTFGALQRNDFLRAALYGFEAYMTRVLRSHGPANADPNNQDMREEAKKDYEDHGPANSDWAEYKKLRGLRNVLAHGNRPRDASLNAELADPRAMRDALEGCLHELLPSESA